MGILFYVQADGQALAFSLPKDLYGYLGPILALGSILLGDFLFKGMTGKFSGNGGLKAKLARYQSASLIKFALVEGAALFSMVLFANTWNLLHAMIGALLILHLIFLRPNLGKIEQQLPLKAAEKVQLRKMDRPLV